MVAERLGLNSLPRPVITVAGSNGKGSVVAMLAAIWRAAGYRVGTYTSPHLLRYNERIQLDDGPASDAALVDAFGRVEAARGATELTYFEFGTLAALWLFSRNPLDVLVLEVGLGGRLDAVNLIDTDCALVTNISLEHQQWLGDDRNSIGREKAAICRPGRPLIFGARDMPEAIREVATGNRAELLALGADYDYGRDGAGWHWRGSGVQLDHLPQPGLVGRHQYANAALALQAVALMQTALPTDRPAIEAGLSSVRVAGRLQRLQTAPELWVDVCHNPAGAEALALALSERPVTGRSVAVFAALNDKDIAAMGTALVDCFDEWRIVALPQARAWVQTDALAVLQQVLPAGQLQAIERAPSAVVEALLSALGRDDRIVVFGSFFTVADVLQMAPVKASGEP